MTAQTILDSSALLAALRGENGASEIMEIIDNGTHMTTVNLAGVITKLYHYKTTREEIDELIYDLPIHFIDVDKELAQLSSSYYLQAKEFGLSLADKICLAAAQRGNYTAITTDKIWAKINLGISVRVIR
jgi:PIN domain nuclease of toxin-antitoxin system